VEAQTLMVTTGHHLVAGKLHLLVLLQGTATNILATALLRTPATPAVPPAGLAATTPTSPASRILKASPLSTTSLEVLQWAVNKGKMVMDQVGWASGVAS